MAEPMITKVTQQISATPTQIQNKAQAKAEPSKFDHVRSKLDKPLGTQQSHIPPEVTRIPAEQKIRIEGEFKKKLDAARLRDLDEIFKADLQESRSKVETVRKALAPHSSDPSFGPVKDRLIMVENQFLESGRLLRGLTKLDRPEDYLKMQFQMYRLTQNVELLSKVAGEMVGGVNKILSTQI